MKGKQLRTAHIDKMLALAVERVKFLADFVRLELDHHPHDLVFLREKVAFRTLKRKNDFFGDILAFADVFDIL